MADQLQPTQPSRDRVDPLIEEGLRQLEQGAVESAKLQFQQLLDREPEHFLALHGLGLAACQIGRHSDALPFLEQAVRINPRSAMAHLSLGIAFGRLNQPQAALTHLQLSLSLRPDTPEALLEKAIALQALHRTGEALATFDRCLAARPDDVGALTSRALTLHQVGRHPEALEDLDRVLALEPGNTSALSARLFMLDFLPDLTFARHQEERRRYFQALRSLLPPGPITHRNDRQENRPLVLGYISADFYRHSAAVCFGPILRHHDRSAFRVYCYASGTVEDDLTREFRAHADRWVEAAGWSDDKLARVIREDAVDLLIDLSGHSMGNRLGVFGRKPAPIQVSAWGQGGGTGLPMVDYQFADPVYLPPWVRPGLSETVYDLPCVITFDPPAQPAPRQEPPALTKGHVTFGSLNRFSKVSQAVLDSWADLLAELPTARILLKDGVLDDPKVRARVLLSFSQRGIAQDRIEFRGHTSREEHLAAYGDVDIALDTDPQNGGITTWESLWMGVPVVARLGDHPASRVSAAILTSLGLDAWICQSLEAGCALARQHAGDLSELSRLRQTLRNRILASDAGNPERYTRLVETAYRHMWRRWLEAPTAPAAFPGASLD